MRSVPDPEFENLDEYEEFLQQQVKDWELARRTALSVGLIAPVLSKHEPCICRHSPTRY